MTAVNYSGPQERLLDITLDAERLSLPEIGRYFKPLATIKLEPAVDVTAKGTLDALNMDVNVVSSAGTARGPLVGHFGSGTKSLEGRLDVRDVDMAPILNRAEVEDARDGAGRFQLGVQPRRDRFQICRARTSKGFGYQAANVRAQGVYEARAAR